MNSPRQEISLTSVATGTLWASCLTIGIIGIVLPYARVHAAKKAVAPMQAEILHIELTNDPLPPTDSPAPPKDLLTPPPASKPIAMPSKPPLIPVAAPNPQIAFALPVTGPTRVVAQEQAAYTRPLNEPRAENVSDQLPVTSITFGRGEGKQPAPTYPPRALREGQEGLVKVVFTVGADGRAVDAELAARSPWPLLNDAALKVVRERWRFSPGPVRRYEVPINFQINRR